MWSCNWPALALLSACATAWRAAEVVAGDKMVTIYQGLAYADVDVIMRRGGHEAVAFSDLQAMEAAALPVLNGAGA